MTGARTEIVILRARRVDANDVADAVEAGNG